MANKREISRGVAGVGGNVTWRKVKLTKLPCRGANSVANLWNRAADEATPLSILYRVQGTPREFSEPIWWFGQCQWSPGLEIVMHGESYVRILNRTSIFTNTFRVYWISRLKEEQAVIGVFDSCTRLSSTTMCLTIKRKGTNTYCYYTKTSQGQLIDKWLVTEETLGASLAFSYVIVSFISTTNAF